VPTQSPHPVPAQRRGQTPTFSSSLTVNPHTPVRAASQVRSFFTPQTPTSSSSCTAVNPHTPVHAVSPVWSPFTPQTPVPSALQTRTTSGRDPLLPIPSLLASVDNSPTSAMNILFYVVIEGDAPGVYGSQ
jgi:hypothetical protein